MNTSESYFLTSEDAQTKASNTDNTHGALRRKLADTQRSIQQASTDIAQYVHYILPTNSINVCYM